MAQAISWDVEFLTAAGVPVEETLTLRSDALAACFGIEREAQAHDAPGDATPTVLTLQHLLRAGRLTASDFTLPA